MAGTRMNAKAGGEGEGGDKYVIRWLHDKCGFGFSVLLIIPLTSL